MLPAEDGMRRARRGDDDIGAIASLVKLFEQNGLTMNRAASCWARSKVRFDTKMDSAPWAIR